MEKKRSTEIHEIFSGLSQSKEAYNTLKSFMHNILNEPELDRLINNINLDLKKVLNADQCLLFLYNSKKKELWTKGLSSGNEKIRFSIEEGIVGKVFQKGNIFITNANQPEDAGLLQEYNKKINFETKSVISVPLNNKSGKIIGIFQGLNKKENYFSLKDKELLLAIEPILSSAILNVQVHKENKKALISFIDAISNTLDIRDYIMAGHSRRVTLYALEIGRKIKLGPKQMEILKFSGLLHDIGKIGVPEVVLFKDRRLSEEEYEILKQHASLTKTILMGVHFGNDLKSIPGIASAHHEKLDGTGYPENLKGDQIPLESRILAVVDVFDALTSRRRFRDRMPLEEVIRTLDSETGSSFDPFIVYNFKLIELNRLLLILEYGHTDRLNEQDLTRLQDYSLKELIEIREKVVKNDLEIEIENIFMRYYLRKDN
jgi:HD-GYP domain-containing protein (c-di-GMP phosphodiesterase class II)